MSQKDKNTLILAGIALLIVGVIILGIKPAFTSIKETKATNAQLSAQKQEMKTEIEALPTYQDNLQNAKIAYNKIASNVYGDLTNDEIQDAVEADLITPIGLTYTAFSVSDVFEQSILNYNPTSEEGVTGGNGEGTIRMVSVNIGVYGSKDQLIQFVDTLDSNPGIYYQSVALSNTETTGSMSVTVYMVLSDTFA